MAHTERNLSVMARFFASPKLKDLMEQVREELRPQLLTSNDTPSDDAVQLLSTPPLPERRESPVATNVPRDKRMLPVVVSLEDWRVVESQKERIGSSMTLDQYDRRLGVAAMSAVAFLLLLIVVLAMVAWYLAIE